MSRASDGRAEYTYADPEHCRCVYVGGPDEYRQYQRLGIERQVARERRWADEAWGVDWGWGPSYRPWL